MEMVMTGFARLVSFLDFLRDKKIHFFLDYQQSGGILVCLTLVGARVEVQFFEDNIEFSTFLGHEDVSSDEAALQALIAARG